MGAAERRLRQLVDGLLRGERLDPEACLEALWDALVEIQQEQFGTAKGLAFTYAIRGNEMFVSRKDKSLTRATVALAFHNALALQRSGEGVAGPKKLKTFGASYLYPIFIRLGVIRAADTGQMQLWDLLS